MTKAGVRAQIIAAERTYREVLRSVRGAVAGAGDSAAADPCPGRALADLAAVIADGAGVISDFRVMDDQRELFGMVASVPTTWRMLSEIAAGGPRAAARITSAVNTARRSAWAGSGPATAPSPAPPSRTRSWTGSTQVSAAVLTRAALFAVLAVVIARRQLRRREVEADRQAAQWLGSPLPLVHLLEAGLRYPPGHARQPPRLLALHPPIPARIAALQDPADRGDGGFGYALVTGVVAAMAMNASYYITWNLDIVAGGWLPALVSAAVAGALLGFAPTPSLIRRAAAPARGLRIRNRLMPIPAQPHLSTLQTEPNRAICARLPTSRCPSP